ncbi:hypothetical protein P7K49_009060 [Saguinus oedipus]|uniref:Secreted protein n=1 Tax=Saguinus oedipus TaxID=9490 RepID=A0ABQ9VZH1_SAGOE|nr:hypothetical protein P7K49_009060 [Saguinus oedipus]
MLIHKWLSHILEWLRLMVAYIGHSQLSSASSTVRADGVPPASPTGPSTPGLRIQPTSYAGPWRSH